MGAVMAISQAQQRALVFAATFFFIASVYLCTTRLFNMSFTHEALGRHAATDTSSRPQQQPQPQPQHDDGDEIRLGPADLPMSYGEYRRPNVDGLSLIASLPREYVPTPGNGRRLLVVGDVHGMDAELTRLLGHVGHDPARDHVVAVGDMVSKGPDSSAVVARLMGLNASAVRGNHEDRVLLSRAEVDNVQGISAQLASPEAERHRGQAAHLAVARSLSSEQVDWLSKLPVVLEAHPLPLYIVHAGLVPGVPVERQDPWAVMNMRTLVYPREDLRKNEKQKKKQDLRRRQDATSAAAVDDDDTIDKTAPDPDRAVAVPVEHRKGEPWPNAWNRHQMRLPKPARRTVIYGHDAKTGHVEGKYTLGIDSGCAAGGALTALVIEGAEDGGFKRKTMQVMCNKAS
ncbi:calcineurin-like phosphoesterase [Hirsutella rhossiliensis]|uniref:Calcineurin-like phosphoesterase domain-containing protein n=1 Tax=Hirsutella rhossiliensis TaxID=111463 RepID=A0A9P8SJQ9_9HYPO|nr:calcineurin-like phosphoesterase domain-containing protein [Hirsutella rhossiliensis]KAH0963980.1 calcineurin-like phosphoesterase domain-containing protein [Hirsutella rhossiliensis]